jgi:beta-glucanase (GH16 family)
MIPGARPALAGCVLLAACGSAATTPTPSPQKVLVFSDEFEGPAGSSPDPAKWTFDIGGGGWGNDELESYTAANARLDGSGNLAIEIDHGLVTGADGIPRDFSSSRLKTQGLFAQAYGRFEARIKIPKGQGIWPAFWMLGGNIGEVGWPACGEIDVMENIGKEPAIVHGTFHGPGYAGAGVGASYSLPGNAPFAADFHVYAVEWDPNTVKWFVDEALYETRTRADLPPGGQWVFDHPFFLLLNVAVGGGWPGPPDETTTFPQEMLVDYVRVYTLPPS